VTPTFERLPERGADRFREVLARLDEWIRFAI
jgi:hypothetical protein